MILEDYLKEYRALTLDVMDRIVRDGEIKYLIEERERILDKIAELNPDNDVMLDICKSLNIVLLEKEMQQMINKEINSVKDKIRDLKKRQIGHEQYNYSLQMRYSQPRFDKKF